MQRESKISPEFIYKGYDLTEQQVVEALTSSSSVKEAARKLYISYGTLKKYAKKYVDPLTGKSLLEKFKNPSGKGVSKNKDKLTAYYTPEKLFVSGQRATSERITKLKEIVIAHKHVNLHCSKCGYLERRLTDLKPPLLISFKNGKRTDWRLENLELLCYNCYFLYIGDPLSKKLINKLESGDLDNEIFKDKLQDFHQMDEVYLNHLKDLGLDEYGDVVDTSSEEIDIVDFDEGEEFIDRI